jgi:uncharacterized membrane protein YdfJ with MMPL/SSD domain
MKSRLLIAAMAVASLIAPQAFAKHSTKGSAKNSAKSASDKKHQKHQKHAKKPSTARLAAPIVNTTSQAV